MKTIREIVNNAFYGKRWRIKKIIFVKPVYRRNAKGQFIGGIKRKGYYLTIPDKNLPKISNVEAMAENITKANALLRKLKF